jgi:hypothetical protein
MIPNESNFPAENLLRRLNTKTHHIISLSLVLRRHGVSRVVWCVYVTRSFSLYLIKNNWRAVQKAAAGVEEKVARDAADKNCLQIKPIFGKSVGITEKIIHIP